MKKIVIYGGTFDPIHNGHIVALQALQDSGHFDEVHLMPAGRSPFKQESADSLHHRFAMTELVSRQLPFVVHNDMEENVEQPSYTYHTLCKLKTTNPDTKYYWSIGFDNLANITSWRESDKLLSEFGLAVINRGGYNAQEASNAMVGIHKTYGTDIVQIQMPDVEISSSDIRHRLQNEQSVYGYLPTEVIGYIRKHGLYMVDTNGKL